MREREREREIERDRERDDFNFKIFRRNIFSQFGEDGIIEEVLKRLRDVSDKQCCEFGAWDGKYLSNTYNLITNHNYEAVLIEADEKKFNELNINIPEKKIIKINKIVNFIGDNTLDNILESTHFNKNFDFLSIDIDGCDYHIFESLSKFTPKLICIEFNPTMGKKIKFFQEKNIKIKQGASARSIIDLGLKKNYFPIAITACNIFFIHNKFKKIVTTLNRLNTSELLQDLNVNYLFYDYDGNIMSGNSVLTYILNIYPFKIFNKFFIRFDRFIHEPIKYLSNLKYYLSKIFR